MRSTLSVRAVGHATSALLAITFTLCVAFDLLFPQYAMYSAWQALVPGFEWLSLKSFLLGLAETYAYGWYFALIWVPVYNLATGSRRSSCCRHDTAGSHDAHAH